MEYYQAETLEKDYQKAAKIIKQIQGDLHNAINLTFEWRVMLQSNIDNMKTSLFLLTKQNDSARVYIAKQQEGSIILESIQMNNDKKMSQLYENENDYKNAYLSMQSAFKALENIHKKNIEETNNLLYAYTDSEFNKNELIKAEIKNKNRAISIIIIVFCSIVAIFLIYFWAWRKEKIAQERIEYLNTMAEFQIAEMEEIKNLAISQEQQKLGMDLHDGLASSVAGIKNRIELILMDAPEDTTKHNLKEIHQQVEQAYISVRNKSLLLYESGSKSLEMQFEKRIKSFVLGALPEPHFENEILIDDNVSDQLPFDSQIELIKITQEAVSNIIKHAKATKVSVLVYEEDGLIQYSIKDNGRGYKTEKVHGKKNSLGINSIKKRAQNIGGKLNISSNENGTEISISIPLRTV